MSFSAKRIRPLALCLFWHQGKLLVFRGYDPVKRRSFYRPAGGEIDFREAAHEAVVREIREELGAKVADVKLLGVLENIFTFLGKPGHEIIFVFNGRFMDRRFYQKTLLQGKAEKRSYEARWVSFAEIRNGRIPLYPSGLLSLVAKKRTNGA